MCFEFLNFPTKKGLFFFPFFVVFLCSVRLKQKQKDTKK